ncbi:MAG: PAS domain-containing protein [Bacteroidota bacterium]
MPISTRRCPVHKPSQSAAQARLALLSDDGPIASPPPKLKLLKVLLEASTDPLVLLDRGLRIVCANRAFAAACGIEIRNLIGRDPFEMITNAPKAIFESARDTGQRFEARHWRYDLPDEPGKAHYWDWSLVPCPDEAGNTEFLLFCTHEVTDHRQDQENVIRAQDQLRSAMRHACLQEEQERRELADRLHEDIIQNLAYWKMQLASLNLPKDSPEGARISAEITDGVGEVIQRLRELTHDLSPAVLYRLGLGPALQWLADRMLEQHGLQVAVEAELERELSEELAVTLYQCIRELLTPLPNEADGGAVRVSVHGSAEQVRVKLEDARERPNDAQAEERVLALQARLAPVAGSLTMDPRTKTTWLRLPLPAGE